MRTFLPRRAVSCSLWLIVIIAAGLPAAYGQEVSIDEQQLLMAQQARQRMMDQVRGGGGVPLEGAINPDEYRVGPGDVFVVGIGGFPPEEHRTTVTADGVLLLPQGGSYPVAGRTLREAQDGVSTRLRRFYRNVSIDVALAEPRTFYVHVSGEIPQPGRHAMMPIARVEDAIAAGMGDRSPLIAARGHTTLLGERAAAMAEPSPVLPSLRNITVRRADGTAISVDLLRYYATGDIAQNPFLLDGDAVYVPSVERDGPRLVFVEREVETGGGGTDRIVRGFDYRDGDSLLSLLLIAGGDRLLDQSSQVRLLRSDSAGRLRAETVDVEQLRSGALPDVMLRPRDRILIPRPILEQGTAMIEGFVRYPGSYPIIQNQTTLRELVEAAGGLRPDGLLRGAFLERRGSSSAVDRNPTALSQRQIAALDRVQQAALFEETVFETARLSDLSFGSRHYMARELVQFPRVSLDLGDLESEIPDVRLRDGDRFFVPHDPGAVLVIGQVRQPGYVLFADVADADYYLAMAGGRGPAAAEVYVREAGSGALREPGSGPIQSGDVVFVDRLLIADSETLQALALQERQMEFQREEQRRAARVQMVQTGVGIIGAAATIVTTYLLARGN